MRPKTIIEKQLAGTERMRGSRVEGLVTLTRVPKPPGYLSLCAITEWKRVAPEAVRVGVTRADLRALALLSESLATESALRAVIEIDGTTIEAGSGGRKSHPALGALATCRTQTHKLLSDFGLIPRGRMSLPPAPEPDLDNPFAQIGMRPQ